MTTTAEPFIIPVETAPIVPTAVLHELALAYAIYRCEMYDGVQHRRPRSSEKLVENGRHLLRVLWPVREAATTAVRERDLPTFGTRELRYGSRLIGELVVQPVVNDVSLYVPLNALWYLSDGGQKPLDTLNFWLFQLGVAGIMQERVGHFGLNNALKLAEEKLTKLGEDPNAVREEMEREEAGWKRAYYRYLERQTITDKRR